MNTRRRFLLGGLGVVAITAMGVVGFGRMSAEAQIVSHVRRRLSFLQLDDAGLHAFAKDQMDVMLAKRPTWNRMKYHFLAVFSKSFSKYDRSTDRRTRTERIEDNLAEIYLLSSDFFINGADPSQLVRYVSFYDPLLRPCGNPFARPVLAPGAG